MSKRTILTVALLAACGRGAASDQETDQVRTSVEAMERFTTAMCACRDRACALDVNAKMTEWDRQMEERIPQDQRDLFHREVTRLSAVLLTRYAMCMNELSNGRSPVPQPAAPTVIEVTATKLFADYRSNEVAANRKYKFERLIVTGQVRRVRAGDKLRPNHVIELVGDTYGEVHCVYPIGGDLGKIEGLRSGQKITVAGAGDGVTIVAPRISSCEIVE